LEDPLEDPNGNTGHEPNPMFDIQGFGPSGSSSLLIQETLIEHLVQDFVVDFGTITVENFRRANGSSKHLILRRTI